MESCRDCPNQYPWLGDAEGTGISGRDNYIYSSSSSDDASAENVGEEQKERRR